MKTRTLALIGFAVLFAAAFSLAVIATNPAAASVIIPGIDPHIIPWD